jgi:hypothetical protein
VQVLNLFFVMLNSITSTCAVKKVSQSGIRLCLMHPVV